MSEEISRTLDMQAGALTAAGSAGATLRAAREAQGLALDQLAATLKVPLEKLEALESDRFEQLPDRVFARALVGSVCRALKIDAASVLAGLPRSQPQQIRPDDAGLNTAFRDGSGGFGRGFLGEKKMVGAAVVAVLLATLAIVFWPTPATVTDRTAAPSVQSLPTVAPPAAVPQPSVAASHALAPVATPADVVAGRALPDVSTPTPTPADGVPVLLLTARGASWASVTDATGKVQLRKTIQAGEAVPLSGAVPLSVILGRADLVSVTVHGKPLDLAGLAKDNVARFEVK